MLKELCVYAEQPRTHEHTSRQHAAADTCLASPSVAAVLCSKAVDIPEGLKKWAVVLNY